MTPISDIFPLTPTQEGLVFESLLSSSPSMYVEQVVIGLDESIDVATLLAAWRHVARTVEALRTVVVTVGLDRPLHVVRTDLDPDLRHVENLPCSAEERAERLRELLDADYEHGFDFDGPPLWRVAVVTWGGLRSEMIFTFHHVLLDGWSHALVLADVFSVYDQLANGFEPMPAVRPSSRAYVEWVFNNQPEDVDEYFSTQLAGASCPTPLPFMSRGTGMAAGSICQHVHELSAQHSALLRGLARKTRTTQATVVHGLWAILIASHTGGSDVIFGSVVSGRSVPVDGIEEIVGCCINTLPVRATVAEDEAVGSFLRRLQLDLSLLREYEVAPASRIRRAAGLSQGEPLFESTVAYQNFSSMSPSVGRSAERDDHSFSESTNFPLNLVVSADLTKGYFLTVNFDQNRIERDHVAVVVRHFLRLLEVVSVDPERRLSELDLMSEEEWSKVVVEWNDSSVEFPVDRSVVDLFEEQVDRSPGAVAVACDGEELSYSELNERANRLAHRLIELGVGPEVLVGVCLSRSVEMLVSVLAVLKAGGAYVPLDPDYPAERLAFMVSDASPHVVLTQLRHERLLAGATSVVCVDGTDVVAGWAVSNPERAVDPENLAYVIYTSGSTGRPKGVQTPSRALTNLVISMAEICELSGHDRVLATTSLAFDISALELLAPLAVGAMVVLHAKDALDVESVGVEIRTNSPTLVQATPSLWNMLLYESGLISGVRALSGGESLSRYTEERLARSSTRAWNAYGPTETTVWSTVAELRRGENGPRIGRPIANTQIYVLDRFFEPVPVGVVGEIFIGGLGVARGYWRRPGLTAERFVPDPFGELGGRLYRTGDLGYWCADGSLQFLGRIDHQVKIRGHRVECGEVESVLAEIPGVVEVAVLATGDPPDSRLVAYLSWEFEPMSVSQLWEAARRHLPDYMIPSSFVAVDSLPLLPNGKLDRNALPPADAQPHIDAQYVAPRTSTEAELARIWADVLGIDSVGVYDNYFDLGGDSIQLMTLRARIESSLGLDVDLRDILSHPSIGEFLCAHRFSEAVSEPLEGEGSAVAEGQLAALRGHTTPLRVDRESSEVYFFASPFDSPSSAYTELAAALDAPISVLGVEASSMAATIGEIAAELARNVARSDYPPIRGVLGWSTGAFVALAIVDELARVGVRAQLVLLEPAPIHVLPSLDPHWPGDDVVAALLGKCEVLLNGASSTQIEKAYALLDSIGEPAFEHTKLEAHGVSANADWHRRRLRIAHEYEPAPRERAPVLFVSSAGGASTETIGGWRRLCGDPINIVEVGADHYGVVRYPGSLAIAKQLADQRQRTWSTP